MKTEKLIATLAKEGAEKSFPKPILVVIGWFCAIAIYFAVLIAFSSLRSDIADKFTQPIYLIELISVCLTAILAAIAASWLALPDCNQKSWVRFIPLMPLMFVVGLLAHSLLTDNSNMTLMECLRMKQYNCLLHIIFYSLIPAILMFYTIHKAASIRCCWSGAMVGLSVGSFSYIILRIIDINDNPMHLLIWHFIPVFIIMMIGMILGKPCFGRIWQS